MYQSNVHDLKTYIDGLRPSLASFRSTLFGLFVLFDRQTTLSPLSEDYVKV